MKKITQISDKEVFDLAGSEVVVDVESYPNYTLVCFEYLEGGHRVYFEWRDSMTPIGFNKVKLRWMLENNVIHTFNGNSYDMIVLIYLLLDDTVTVADMYEATQDLISRGVFWRKFFQQRRIEWGLIKCNHVDLIEVAFGQSSLKLYAGRLHAPKMQDLPYPHWLKLTEEQMDNVLMYCWNDTQNTIILKNFLEKDLELRRQMGIDYGVDLRSKSDAQVAEAVIGRELKLKYGIEARRPELPSDYSFKYKIPDNVKFRSKVMKNALEVIRNATFRLSEADKVVMPAEIKKLKIKMKSDTVYTMGIGGLHSTEKDMYYEHDEDVLLIDRDVASYYPAIILNQGLYPSQLTTKFLEVYRRIVETRLAAKAAGDKRTANTLKIVINGSFGKFGSCYSILFSPDLLIQTTISGQLYLLMLIERLEIAGFNVISGNTDGIVTRMNKERYDEFNTIISDWEKDTRFDTEETQYHSYFARDVNNYIAVGLDGSIKSKGCFGNSGISKNPNRRIVYRAVQEFVSKGIDPRDTINACTDITEFITVRKVTGGCVDAEGNEIGGTIRYYLRKGEFGFLRYKINGNKVPTTDGACPIMDLSVGFPDDIDYEAYVREAKALINAWYNKKVQLGFDFG